MIWVELDGGVCYELGDDSSLLPGQEIPRRRHTQSELQRDGIERTAVRMSPHSRIHS